MSLVLNGLDCKRIVIGPENCRKSLSPQMAVLDHVQILKTNVPKIRQAGDSRTILAIFVSGIILVTLGTCIRNDEDLRRYGSGKSRLTVYATILLYAIRV